jgi:hypothetical protein
MRLLVRDGLKMIGIFSTTHHFSWSNDNTQLLEATINLVKHQLLPLKKLVKN